jgi:hypothetical protein
MPTRPQNLHTPDFPATVSLLLKLLSDTVHSLAISMKGGLSNEEQKWATVVEGILEWWVEMPVTRNVMLTAVDHSQVYRKSCGTIYDQSKPLMLHC